MAIDFYKFNELRAFRTNFMCIRLSWYTPHNFDLQDDGIGEIIDAGGRTITVTIMPSFLYDHICKWWVLRETENLCLLWIQCSFCSLGFLKWYIISKFVIKSLFLSRSCKLPILFWYIRNLLLLFSYYLIFITFKKKFHYPWHLKFL